MKVEIFEGSRIEHLQNIVNEFLSRIDCSKITNITQSSESGCTIISIFYWDNQN